MDMCARIKFRDVLLNPEAKLDNLERIFTFLQEHRYGTLSLYPLLALI